MDIPVKEKMVFIGIVKQTLSSIKTMKNIKTILLIEKDY